MLENPKNLFLTKRNQCLDIDMSKEEKIPTFMEIVSEVSMYIVT